MSKSQIAMEAYTGLSPVSRHLLQLCAVYYTGITRTDLVKLSNKIKWTDASGKLLVVNKVKGELNALVEANLLVKTRRSADLDVTPELKDFAVQEAIREGAFEIYAKGLEAETSGRRSYSYLYSYGPESIRDLRIAFYRNDVERFEKLYQLKPIAWIGKDDGLGVLQPFNADIFDGLDAKLRTRFLIENADAAIVFGEGTAEALQKLETVVLEQGQLAERLVSGLLDIYVARGDVAGLQRLAEQAGSEWTEVTGCAAFLKGDYEQAERDLEAAWTRLRKASRKRRLALRHLAGLFHVCLLMQKNTPADRKRAAAMLQVVSSEWSAGYKWVAEFLNAGLSFQAAPVEVGQLFRYQVGGSSMIAKLVAGYVWRWFGPRTTAPVSAEGWQEVLLRYQALGLDWLVAETAGLLSHSKIKKAKTFESRHREGHEALGTMSMLRLLEPEARWQRSLKALMQLHQPDASPQASTDEPDERLIWEMNYGRGHYFSLRPFVQKRK